MPDPFHISFVYPCTQFLPARMHIHTPCIASVGLSVVFITGSTFHKHQLGNFSHQNFAKYPSQHKHSCMGAAAAMAVAAVAARAVVAAVTAASMQYCCHTLVKLLSIFSHSATNFSMAVTPTS